MGLRQLQMSESDVYRRQILMSKVDPMLKGINTQADIVP